MEKYNAGKMVGSGGFGKAFLCSRIHDDKACVIKKVDVARRSFKDRQKAADEANLLAKLSHPNIVRYWEGFFDGLVLCMVMDYAEGGDLSSHLQSRRQGSSVLYIAEEQVLGWLVQMTQALGYLHGRNILHRDLKPHNIFLTCSGVVKLGDFGIAKVLENTIDLTRTIIGTPFYMSPEMFQHKAYNHKADMWSLGCVLYEMVSLRCAFQGSLIQILVAHQQELPPIPSSYSAEMHHLIKGLLQNNPEARLSTGDILSQPFVKRYPEDSMIGPSEGPDSAETLEVPWDPMENARMEALRQVDSGGLDIGNPDIFIKQMLNTDLRNILRQVEYALERGHRSPRVSGLRHRRSQRVAREQCSPLTIAGWCAVVFAVAAVIVVHVLAPPIRFLSIRNQTQMHDVFRGKEPWVVLCKKKGPDYNSAYSRFETASRTLTELAKFGVVDCSGPLPSGKSITQKFGLTNRLNTPILFVAGADLKPVQASPWNMDSEASLVKWASIAITPTASPVTSTRSLETKCMKKEQCVLIMLAGQLESAEDYALKEVMARHRKVRFVSMDATKLETSIEKRFDIKPVDGAHHFVHFTRYNVPVNAKTGTPRWGVQVYRGQLDTDSMSVFLGGNEEKQGLRHAPTVSTRKATKKKQPRVSATSRHPDANARP